MSSPILELRNIAKHYRQGDTSIQVLQAIDLVVNPGDSLAIVGQSGSGKSTLLSLMAGLDRPDHGEIFFQQKNVNAMTEKELGTMRAKGIGIVFQQFHLMPALDALENVMLPLEINKVPQAEKLAKEALDVVGLGHRMLHLPRQLSGGERQRVAIARAFVLRPALLLADEPSGNLDQETGAKVMELLFRVIKETKMTMILVTHNMDLAQRCTRVTHLERGILNETTKS